MRAINAFTIGPEAPFVKRGRALYRARQNGYNTGSPRAEVAELADA